MSKTEEEKTPQTPEEGEKETREKEIQAARDRSTRAIQQRLEQERMYSEKWVSAQVRDRRVKQVDDLFDRDKRRIDSLMTTALDSFDSTNANRMLFRDLMMDYDQTVKGLVGERDDLKREVDALKKERDGLRKDVDEAILAKPEDVEKKLDGLRKKYPPRPVEAPQQRQERLAKMAEEEQQKAKAKKGQVQKGQEP